MGLLLLLYVASCCWSLVNVADYHRYIGITRFDKAQVGAALPYVLSCAALALFFAVKRFSFDYFVGFHYTRWCCAISGSSNFPDSNNWLAAISAFASILAFLVPALFITSRIRQRLIISERALDLLLSAILTLAAAIVATAALYNFRMIGIEDIYEFRLTSGFPVSRTIDRHHIGRTAAVRVCLLRHAAPGIAGRRSPRADAALLSSHADQARAEWLRSGCFFAAAVLLLPGAAVRSAFAAATDRGGCHD
jgi:hypothetical protein